MGPDFDRRALLQALVGAAALLPALRPASSWAAQAGAQAAAAEPPTPLAAIRLSKDLLLITGAGANVVVVSGPDGLVLIDGGLPNRSADLLAFVEAQTGGQRVRVLFNTQWHSDHTGSNEALGMTGVRIIAHQNTRRWLGSRVTRESQNRVYPPRPAHALPTETITRPGALTWGSQTIEYGPLPPAHTNGDLYVFFPGPNVLLASDVLTVGRYPAMDYSTGGWIGGLIEASAILLALGDDATRIVPGLGPVQTRAALQAERAMLVAVSDRVQALIRQGKSLPEVMAAAPTREFDSQWGDPAGFLAMVYISLVRHTHEMGGIL